MTSQLTTATETTGFDRNLAEMAGSLEGQLLVSQDRCIDGLLDLYNTAPTEVVRRLVTDIIDDMRHVSAVKTADLQAKLDVLAAAAAVESAFFS